MWSKLDAAVKGGGKTRRTRHAWPAGPAAKTPAVRMKREVKAVRAKPEAAMLWRPQPATTTWPQMLPQIHIQRQATMVERPCLPPQLLHHPAQLLQSPGPPARFVSERFTQHAGAPRPPIRAPAPGHHQQAGQSVMAAAIMLANLESDILDDSSSDSDSDSVSSGCSDAGDEPSSPVGRVSIFTLCQ